MLFNSLDFAIFLPIVFFLYWFVFYRNLKLQNLFVVAASYVFYGWWDWRFLSLILISTLIDYFVGIALSGSNQAAQRKTLLSISIFSTLGLLGFFKYYNFFIENFTAAFSFFGVAINANSLNIILPVGISFYTFQTLSYTIDVYKRKCDPTKDFIAFAAFVSFFPQLVAGPIERARNLLPQFTSKRNFDYDKAIDGLRQILWGFFKKIVIADQCANYANTIFNNSNDYSGSTLALGAVLFAFQIYGDFSGYSDIAIGISRLFGFNLAKNFAFPYFSRDIAEFWRRWHISLSTWFRDYLYIPLGGSRGGTWNKIRNIFIIFIVSGFWHGARWNFIAWGALHASFFLPLMLLKKNREHLAVAAEGKYLPSANELMGMITTFGLTTFAWIFFRAENMSHAFSYISEIFSPSLLTIPTILPGKLLLLISLFFSAEWIGRAQPYALADLGRTWPRPLRWGMYYGVIITVILWRPSKQQFIYFQF